MAKHEGSTEGAGLVLTRKVGQRIILSANEGATDAELLSALRSGIIISVVDVNVGRSQHVARKPVHATLGDSSAQEASGNSAHTARQVPASLSKEATGILPNTSGIRLFLKRSTNAASKALKGSANEEHLAQLEEGRKRALQEIEIQENPSGGFKGRARIGLKASSAISIAREEILSPEKLASFAL